MLRLCGELCDGVLPLRFTPADMPRYRKHLEEGFRRAGNGKSWGDFSFEALAPVIVTDEVRGALQSMKPGIALYVGGMGHPTANFHKQAMDRHGYADVAARIEELFRSGRTAEAAAAVPDEFVDEQALVGPPSRIALRQYLDISRAGRRAPRPARLRHRTAGSRTRSLRRRSPPEPVHHRRGQCSHASASGQRAFVDPRCQPRRTWMRSHPSRGEHKPPWSLQSSGARRADVHRAMCLLDRQQHSRSADRQL